MARINKVLYDVDQRADTTATEKKIARDNIGAVDIEAVYEVRDYARDLAEELENNKQDNLTAGENIQISNGTISAKDTTYSAGDGIKINNKVISADFSLKTVTTALPPVETVVSDARVFSDGRVMLDGQIVGLLAPYPGQADAGKVLKASYSGSPARGFAEWEATEKPNWNFEELSSVVEWTGVGVGTWKPLKTFTIEPGKTISVTVQGVATWTEASAGEGIAVLQLDTADGYVNSPLRRTSLVAVQQTSGTGFVQFSATLHYTNAGANPITLFLGAYNAYGIGSASLSLRSALPSDTVGPNIQWCVN